MKGESIRTVLVIFSDNSEMIIFNGSYDTEWKDPQ